MSYENCIMDGVCEKCGKELDSESGLRGDCDCVCHRMV